METFKLIIAGGRDFSDYALLHKKVDVLLASKRFTCQIEIFQEKQEVQIRSVSNTLKKTVLP